MAGIEIENSYHFGFILSMSKLDLSRRARMITKYTFIILVSAFFLPVARFFTGLVRSISGMACRSHGG